MKLKHIALLLSLAGLPLAAKAGVSTGALELYYSFDSAYISGTYVNDQWTAEGGLYDGVDTVWNSNPLSTFATGAKFGEALDVSTFALRPHQNTIDEVNAGFLPGLNDYTVTFWYRQSTPTAQTAVFGAGAWANDVNHSQGLLISVSTNGQLVVTYQDQADTTGVRKSFTAGSPIWDGATWNHLALVRTGTDLRLWVNGNSAGFATLSSGYNLAVSSAEWTRELYLGDYGGWPYTPLDVPNSAFDDMALFHRALSASEIAQIWNSGSGATIDSLLTSCSDISLSPATLATGTEGSSYSQAITASGGIAPYAFAMTAGSLPSGLSLATNGVLTGTPTSAAFSTSFTVTATDTNGCIGTSNYSITISARFRNALELYYSFDSAYINGTYAIDQWTREAGLYEGVDTVWNVNPLSIFATGAKFGDALDVSTFALRPHQNTIDEVNAGFLPGLNDYTVTFWYRQSTPTVQTAVFGAGASADDVNHSQGLLISVAADGQLLVTYQDEADWTGIRKSFTAGSPIFDGATWNHIALVRTGTDLRLWVNGSAAGFAALNSGYNLAVSPLEWTRELYLGDYGGWPYTPLDVSNSAFDDMAIFHRALSASELAQIWNSGTGKPIGSLIGPTSSIPLAYTLSDGKLVMRWADASFQLSAATNVAGPYVPISGATSPYTNAPTAPREFFRLVYP